MTRNRTHRGRRRNRDRSVNPGEQQVTQADAEGQPAAESSAAEPTQQASTNSPPERRRRRGRGRSQARQNAVAEATKDVVAEQPAASERRSRPAGDEPGQRPRSAPDGGDRRSRPPADGGDRRARPSGDQRDDGNRRPNRRRQGRRQTFQPITGEIFKASLRTSSPSAEPLSLRQGVEADSDGLPVLGCPMLTRTRLGMPFAGGRHTPRCALGWAVHSETEAGYCMATPLVSQCWKLHPERFAELTEESEDRAAD